VTVTAFGAAKGSPGVTTSVVALAGAWPSHREALVVEADGAGGDLVARLAGIGDSAVGVRAEPSTVQLAAAVRGGMSDRVVLEHLQRLPGAGEVRALVAPSSPFAAATALGSLIEAGFAGCLAGLDGLDVLVDLGRLDAGSSGVELVAALGEVVLVVRPRVTSVIHTRDLAESLRQSGISVSLLIVGDSPYAPDEVARSAGGLGVVGVLADDPQGAAALDGAARTVKAWSRSRIVRSSAAVADQLAPAPLEAPETEALMVATVAAGLGGPACELGGALR
jgi:hypothetical protein